jgi:hypothetical protein
MNKAFIREPEDSGQRHCPRCGSLGTAVGAATLDQQLAHLARSSLAAPAFFCPFAHCEVAYFDLFERIVLAESLPRAIYPKDPTAPICPCFDFCTDQIDEDIREGGVTRVRSLLARAQSREARCEQMSPSGHSCVPEVQRYYMKQKQPSQPS